MKCVILQPSYIPWRGFFHQIALADVFIFFDNVQYDKRGWRNRNIIKTPTGVKWLTIPVHSKGSQTEHIPINQISIAWEKPWNQDHLQAIFQSYNKAPYFNYCFDFLSPLMAGHPEFLADFTIELTSSIAAFIGIEGKQYIRSSSLEVSGEKTEKLINILEQVGANHYISGPSARNYIDEQQFLDHKISLEYMTYSYPNYSQLYPPFDGNVSIIDLIFMTGPAALDYIIK